MLVFRWASLARSRAAAASAAVGVKVPANQRFVLPNGLTIVLVPKKDVPLIAFSGFVRGGALARSRRQARRGIAGRRACSIAAPANATPSNSPMPSKAWAAASTPAPAQRAISVSGQFLARDRALMIELLADALMRPHFDADEFTKLPRSRDRVHQVGQGFRSLTDSSASTAAPRCSASIRTAVRRAAANVRSRRITQRDVVSYHAANFGADRATLVFAGDLDPKWMKQALTHGLRRLGESRRRRCRYSKPAPRVTGRRVLLVDSPGSAQTYFWLGNVGVDRRYSGRPALDLVNTLYGGRFTSILNTELRIKSGLSYGASSRFTRGTVPGEFAIRSFTQTDNTGKALDLTLETLEQLKHDALAPEMLESARAYVLGQFPLQLETAAHWAATLADLEFYGLGKDYIEGYGPALAKVDLAETAAVTADAFRARRIWSSC